MDKVKIGFPIEYEDENNIVRNGLYLRESEIKELEKRLKEINKITYLEQQCKQQKEIIDKAIELLGNYKHYSTPDEKQNGDNEDLVNNALDILKEVSE